MYGTSMGRNQSVNNNRRPSPGEASPLCECTCRSLLNFSPITLEESHRMPPAKNAKIAFWKMTERCVLLRGLTSKGTTQPVPNQVHVLLMHLPRGSYTGVKTEWQGTPPRQELEAAWLPYHTAPHAPHGPRRSQTTILSVTARLSEIRAELRKHTN